MKKLIEITILLLWVFVSANSAHSMIPHSRSFPGGLNCFLEQETPVDPRFSMIEVEHGLHTSHVIIDGSRQTPHGYSLLRDILNVFRDSNWYTAEIDLFSKPPSDAPSVVARNLSAEEAVSLFTALDMLLMDPYERKRVVAIYLNNVDINFTSAEILATILKHNQYLQNLWLNHCKIEGNDAITTSTPKPLHKNALDRILEGIMASKLQSFWLHDDTTDFRLPPAC